MNALDMKEFYRPLKIATFAILERPLSHEWTTQGLGMIRTYLDPEKVWRLNVWHSMFRIPEASTIHDHPWHLDSWVLAGRFFNQRMRIANNVETGVAMDYFTIRTGINHDPAKDRGPVKTCNLVAGLVEEYEPGDYYHQDAEEIHETTFVDGAVTINRRNRIGTGEHAKVFWPHRQEWVDAKPAVATIEQVLTALNDVRMDYNG